MTAPPQPPGGVPTTPGWYWYDDGQGLRTIAHVIWDGSNLYARSASISGFVGNFDGHWSPRIPDWTPPQPETLSDEELAYEIKCHKHDRFHTVASDAASLIQKAKWCRVVLALEELQRRRAAEGTNK